MSLLGSMVELHQWWDIYSHHWSQFFTARSFSSLMWEAYQAMKWLFWQLCHCCQAWLNCTSGEIFTAITGRSSSLLGTLFLLCERLIKQWNSYSEYVAKHGWTAPVVRYLMPSLVRVLLCWKRNYWWRSTELPTTCWKWNHLCSSHGILSRWKKYKGIV